MTNDNWQLDNYGNAKESNCMQASKYDKFMCNNNQNSLIIFIAERTRIEMGLFKMEIELRLQVCPAINFL